MTADVQRELAEALNRGQQDGALLPTVQRLIADAEKGAAAQALRDAADNWELRGLTLTAGELRTLADRAEAPDCPWPSGPCLGEPCPDRGRLGRRAELDPS